MDQAEGIAQPAWAPPSDFDEYRLVRLLGRGAMGQVYLAHDTLLDRPVAIKFIATARPAPRARERLLTEARAIARLQHPNVVAIHRAGEVDGRPYLVSEFLRGQSLAEAARPMPPSRVLSIGLCLARGLSAAHRRGVLHRDIKPANVMILPDGEAKLLDFGLAKLIDPGPPSPPGPPGPAPPTPVSPPSSRPAAAAAVDGAARGLDETASLDEASGASAPGTGSGTGPAGTQGPGPARPLALTGQGEILGTPLYMAPEVWREGPVTPRSDVYSLGALLFELCTGRPPHREETLAALGDAIIGRDAPDLAALSPDLDPRLCAVIQRCLRREPAARFASGEELAQALQEIEARAVAPPAGNPYRGLRAFEAEHRALFFGRGAEVRAVLEQLRAEPLVLLAGDSGVGKSSLCRAGVLPLVCEGALQPGDGRRWAVAALLPGRRPLQALADALPRDLADLEGGLLPLLREQPALEAGRALRQRLGERAGVVLFIDQMEELLTQSEPDEALLFSAIIGELGARVPGVRVLATARGDALTRLSALPGLGPTLARAVHVVRPLSRDELCEAVLGPARAMGFGFETEALVEELVRYAAGAEGGLPLLQFALAELWEARDPDRGIIPATALARIGGVAGALSRHADAVLAGLLPEQRAAARRILTHLVTVQGRRVRRTEEELRAGPADVAVLESLVRGRLLLAREAEGRTVYEVAHEALAQGWATLRRWLAADEDRRAARERLAAAAAEWERLGRARDSLWGERQLAEARALGLGRPDGGALTLGPRERAFLLASQRDLSRRRWTRRGLILGAPLFLALAYGGFALQARQRVAQEIAGHMNAADALLRRARAANGVVEAQRQAAFARFDRGDRDVGEAEWARARQLAEGAEDLYAQASAELDAALLLDDRDAAVHRRLAAALYERALLAERDHRRAQLDQLLTWLGRHDLDGAWHRRFRAPARLVLRGLPAGAAVTVQRYEDRGGVRVLGAPARLPAGGAVEKELAPGSYLLHFFAPGRAPLRHPVLLGRGERREVWGVMPAAGAVPPGMVYVPAGRFLYGSTAEEELRRDMLKAPPLHAMEGSAYLIGRTEVTFAAWIEYLRAVGREERAARLPRSGDGALALRELPDGTFQLALRPTTQVYTAREGEKIRYPGRVRRAAQDWLRMPVSGISWDDAWAYADWLRRSGRLPGARLCTEMEWERAARGADDRSYPHGDLLAADDANHDRTYGRHPLGFGPDEVGSHPLSDSPFSVADLAGNVWEMVRGTGGEIVFASGSWYKEALVSAATNRNFGERSMRHVLIGLRLCADPR